MFLESTIGTTCSKLHVARLTILYSRIATLRWFVRCDDLFEVGDAGCRFMVCNNRGR
jgi:hypothetical protein